jgi:hypothetical protein
MFFDIDGLREDLEDDCYGAFFGGGYGGAMIEAMEIEDASDEELIRIAREKGIDLGRYEE